MIVIVMAVGFAALIALGWQLLQALWELQETLEEADELYEETAPEETRETESERRARKAIERFNTGVAEILRYDGEENEED